jgi:hypothetical protein
MEPNMCSIHRLYNDQYVASARRGRDDRLIAGIQRLSVRQRTDNASIPGYLPNRKPHPSIQGHIMDTKSKACEQHASAAKHHDAAAQHHREAAKALEAGHPEQAATHAQVAHGHLAHAAESAAQVSKIQAAQHDGAAKKN